MKSNYKKINPIYYIKKNIGFILFFGVILFSLYYFSKSTVREGITQAQFDRLATALAPPPEQQKLQEYQKDYTTQKNNLADLAQKVKLDTAAYNAALLAFKKARDKVAEQEIIVAPIYNDQFLNVQAIGITDDIYSLLILEDTLTVPKKIGDLQILVDDAVNIVG
jgi:hypothetical protein